MIDLKIRFQAVAGQERTPGGHVEMTTEVRTPPQLRIGAGARHELAAVLRSVSATRPLIITDPTMTSLGPPAALQAELADADIDAVVYDNTVPEPTVSSLTDAVSFVRDGDFDALVAIGGGSPIDSAKAIGVVAKHGGSITDYRFPTVVENPGLPVITIPTTAGTGSEVTRFTIVTDDGNPDEAEKLLCVGSAYVPAAALVDFELTLTLPKRQTADTGLDALTHAMEAYVSRRASPFADAQAIAAMRLIGPNLRTAYSNGSDREAREAMMLGATLAGIAFSTSSVALVHGMSRPIGAAFHVPHGLSNAMLLPAVTEYSLPASAHRYRDCAVALGFATERDGLEIATDKFLTELKALNADLAVPTPTEFGIDSATFVAMADVMAEQAMASGSPANNPRVPTIPEMAELYRTLA